MPANLRETDEVIEKLPADRVYILDQMHKELSYYPAIYQNFKKDIINALTNGLALLKKYKKFILLFQEEKQPSGMLTGFKEFCETYNFENEIIKSVENRIPVKEEVYLIPDDRNLIRIIKKAKEENLVLSKDIGIISYNDTLLKEVVLGGITTISTDFNQMGKRLAQMVLNNEKLKIENPNSLILRNSL